MSSDDDYESWPRERLLEELALKRGELFAAADECLRLGNAERALEVFDGMLGHDLGHFVLLHRRGVALAALGRHAEALAAYDLALQPEAPGSTPFFVGCLRAVRSDCLRALGRFDEALTDSEIAIKLCPNVPESYVSRARALLALGRASDAIDWYDAVLDNAAKFRFDDTISIEGVAAEREQVASLVLSHEISEDDPQS